MKHYRYEFRTAEGEPCCSGNNIKYLCPHCRTAALELADAESAYRPPRSYGLTDRPPIALDAHGYASPDTYGLRAKRKKEDR